MKGRAHEWTAEEAKEAGRKGEVASHRSSHRTEISRFSRRTHHGAARVVAGYWTWNATNWRPNFRRRAFLVMAIGRAGPDNLEDVEPAELTTVRSITRQADGRALCV